ncbi:hypothetical protein ILUMI_04688 [Ignelater luminosus]|uniref:RING-type E3 ubiquitin transferase n=1 Tax=Ignelater luminosus TaxID=2038154 RepID=A0A8K0D8H9_IGNLU|nr:hypothetical protein ILUMI_04688 [Ignelater luminosus]
MAEPDLCDCIMEEFRCFHCKKYLSVSPIAILPDGNSLCGICSSSAKETYKELVFEDFLKTLLYPCKFKDRGCKERLKFGEAQDHEGNCCYHPFMCPVFPYCTWQGSVAEMLNHFYNCHSNIIAKQMTFKLAVYDNDQSGFRLACVDGANAILKYYYNVSTGNLQYHIYNLNPDVQEIKVKIGLLNDADMDYGFYLKGDPLSLFNESFYKDFSEIPNSKTLALHNLFPVLNNPNYVRINITLQIVKSDENEKHKYDKDSKQFVDYDLIKDLKCSMCLGLLFPPVYRNPTSDSAICFYCHTRFTEECELNEDIIERVSETNFPCHWRGCETIKSEVNLVDHELSCKLRMLYPV